jgi:hypothetical protein
MIISSGAHSALPMVVAPKAIVECFSSIVSKINSCFVGANLLSPPSHSLLANCHIQYLSSACICRVYLWFCTFFMTSAAKFLYTSLWISANHFVGSAVILYFSPPLVGCRFLSVRHVSAHVPSPGRYIRGNWRFALFTSSLSPPPPLFQSLRPAILLPSPQAQIVDACEALGKEEQNGQG